MVFKMKYTFEEEKAFLDEFKQGQGLFGENMAVIVNSVLLSLIYLVGVGSTAVLAKIFRKKFLDLDINKRKDTYWTDLNLNKKLMEDYYHQF